VVLAPLLNTAMMRSRGSRRGFSRSMLAGFVLLTVGFWAWMFLSDAYFRLPFFWLAALGNVGISLQSLWEFERLPPYPAGRAARGNAAAGSLSASSGL